MPLISIVIPLHNEASNLLPLYQKLREVTDPQKDFGFEFIFVDDGSHDKSFMIIESLAHSDSRIHYLQFSRNFGKELATTAGIHHAAGDAVMMMDADLQHPPELIPEFLKKWQRGGEVVIGIRIENTDEGMVKRLGSKLFYWISNLISETKIRSNATDFRLLDRVVVDEFNRFSERERLTRGLIDWLGFQQDTVEFTAPARFSGVAKYNFFKLMKLFVTTFVSHSLFPLKLAGYLGVLIILISGPLGIFIFYEKYWAPYSIYDFTGSAALAVIILFLIGMVLSCLGLIALYIANIHTEVTDRPLYVIRKRKVSSDE